MNAQVPANQVDKFDMQFENEEGGCPDCRFDTELKNGTLIEFKSYKDLYKIPLKQFKAYIGSIDNIGQLRYVFNKNKASLSEAKDGVAKFISTNKTEIWGVISDELKTKLGLDPTGAPEELTNNVINQIVNQFVEVY